MTTAERWTAQLDGVREVSLRGSADFEFWQKRLADEGLRPSIATGRHVS